MPKPLLAEPFNTLESQLAATMMAGLKEYRPDLDYPETASDMQACIRAVLRHFNVERLPLARELPVPCDDCEGLGHLVTCVTSGCRKLETCPTCKGSKVRR